MSRVLPAALLTLSAWLIAASFVNRIDVIPGILFVIASLALFGASLAWLRLAKQRVTILKRLMSDQNP